MKKYYLFTMALTAFSVFFSLAVSGAAQVKPRVGGYKVISKTSTEARAAAEFAVEAQNENDNTSYRLESIEKAESQTVAGTNYRFCLQVILEDEDTEEEIREFYQVVVFRSLKKEFSLKSWSESDCGEKK
jgi:hypothetical protein